ncbi:MAG: histidine ammonia-lyase [Thermoleophilia bacterium]|nr:histidine ammonia-lyase [Thermoleophilia bacterium]
MASTARDTTFDITGFHLPIEEVERVALGGVQVRLGAEARARVAAARGVVDRAESDELSTYGLNTGVGRFVDKHIPAGLTTELQKRVLRSHAAGVGDPYPDEVVRAAQLLRINTLALGYSGVRETLVDHMVAVLNAGILPFVPARGSVGASGDLAPLSHLCLPIVGEGKAYVDGELMSGSDALASRGLKPLDLASKEGLSLINGTQFMTAMGIVFGLRARRLMRMADLVAALSVEALRGSNQPFLPQIHELRPHEGQRVSAANMHAAMEGSTILDSHRWCDRVQDAYSLRCAPQVHGASRDALEYGLRTFQIEAQSVTDNPLVFPEEGLLRSNGNFHGQPCAISLDLMAIALAEVANISERRTGRLVDPSLSGLPAFLVEDGGLNSGYMIAQYTAAALVSENKVYCHPASVDSIPTSAAQEDHVSMGNHAGLKLLHVLENAERVVAIELLCATQGVEFLVPRTPGRGAGALHAAVRARVPTLKVDRILSDEIELVARLVSSADFIAEVEAAAGMSVA